MRKTPGLAVVGLLGLVLPGNTPLLAAEGREGWEGSRVRGTPDPPAPYAVDVAFPGLSFRNTAVMDRVPGTRLLILGELGGKIVTFPDDPKADAPATALEIKQVHGEMGALYGLAFHPKFAENRQVFLCYTMGDGKPDGTRVTRWTMTNDDPPRIDPKSERVILTWMSGGHNGGCLAFGPEGCLYISTGDGSGPFPPDTLGAGQDMTRPLSKVLRIDVDREEEGRPYRIPPDNPFVDLPGAYKETWAYGFRNPWKMTFDDVTGDLWLGDVGWELWELVYRIERGGNYGWSVKEGRQPARRDLKPGPTPILPPIVDHPHSEAGSITGGFVYRGDRLPELKGAYIYGDWLTGTIWGLRYDPQARRVTWRAELARSPVQIVSFGLGSDGELYFSDYERSQKIYRLVPNKSAQADASFPTLLSETGVFSSAKDQTPAEGVIPYQANTEIWADGATSKRWLAIPGRGRVDWDETKPWKVPEGTVLAKTISLGERRLETQLLHFEEGSWRPYTYVWNPEQSDATLAPAEGTSVEIPLEGGGTRPYRISSRSECMICHNPWTAGDAPAGRQSAPPLGFDTPQLNKGDQLARWQAEGWLQRPLPKAPEALPKSVDPHEESASIDARARNYLHLHCAACHRFQGGGAAKLVLTRETPLEQTSLLEPPIQGGFGLGDARVIAPGLPEASVLYLRMAKLGAGHMPRIGSSQVDEKGLELIRRWIESLDKSPSRPELERIGKIGDPTSESCEGVVRELCGTTRGALALVHWASREPKARPMILKVVREQGRPDLVELFERFLPESARVRRLGDDFEPSALLALSGDAGRGEALFLENPTLSCRNCHAHKGIGRVVGPDLSKIGSKYPKAEILDQILKPSKAVDEEYRVQTVETKDGRLINGLVVRRTDAELELRDAEGKSVVIPTTEIEQTSRSAQSLMPEGALRDMTAQEVADLLAFLESLKGS